jgi:hypothetical protein
LNADGLPDLLVSANQQVGNLRLLLSTGAGAFAAPIDPQLAATAFYEVAIGDLDGDGFGELVFSTDLTSQLLVFHNLGAGHFEPSGSYAVASPFAPQLADVNGDGLLDAVVANYADDGFNVLLGTAGGRFAPAVQYLAGKSATAIAIADLDGDGWLDLAVAGIRSGTLTILVNRQGQGFEAVGTYPTGVNPAGVYPSTVVAADLDGDARVDLIVRDVYGSESVLLGRGDHSFAPALEYAGDFSAYGLQAFERSAAGQPQLLYATSTGKIRRIEPTCLGAPPTPAATSIAATR